MLSGRDSTSCVCLQWYNGVHRSARLQMHHTGDVAGIRASLLQPYNLQSADGDERASECQSMPCLVLREQQTCGAPLAASEVALLCLLRCELSDTVCSLSPLHEC